MHSVLQMDPEGGKDRQIMRMEECNKPTKRRSVVSPFLPGDGRLHVDLSVTLTQDYHMTCSSRRIDKEEEDGRKKTQKKTHTIQCINSCIPVNFMQCKKSKLYIYI